MKGPCPYRGCKNPNGYGHPNSHWFEAPQIEKFEASLVDRIRRMQEVVEAAKEYEAVVMSPGGGGSAIQPAWQRLRDALKGYNDDR